MGLLDNFEKGLERAVNGAFAKTFRSGLQPVEITSALKREIDTKAAVVSRDRVLVPNNFTVRLAPADFDRMTGLGPALIDELVDLVQKHAASQHFQFAGGITIGLDRDAGLSVGMVQVDSLNVKGQVAWTPRARRQRPALPDPQGPHRDRPRQRGRHHPRRLGRLAAGTPRCSGTAVAPGCATSAPRTARS